MEQKLKLELEKLRKENKLHKKHIKELETFAKKAIKLSEEFQKDIIKARYDITIAVIGNIEEDVLRSMRRGYNSITYPALLGNLKGYRDEFTKTYNNVRDKNEM